MQFPPNQIGGKSCAYQGAIQRSQLLLIDFAAEQPQLPLNPLPHHHRGIGFFGGILQRRFNVTVGNAARPQLPRDPELSLLPRLRPVPRELPRIPCVINQVLPASIALPRLLRAFHPRSAVASAFFMSETE